MSRSIVRAAYPHLIDSNLSVSLPNMTQIDWYLQKAIKQVTQVSRSVDKSSGYSQSLLPLYLLLAPSSFLLLMCNIIIIARWLETLHTPPTKRMEVSSRTRGITAQNTGEHECIRFPVPLFVDKKNVARSRFHEVQTRRLPHQQERVTLWKPGQGHTMKNTVNQP